MSSEREFKYGVGNVVEILRDNTGVRYCVYVPKMKEYEGNQYKIKECKTHMRGKLYRLGSIHYWWDESWIRLGVLTHFEEGLFEI